VTTKGRWRRFVDRAVEIIGQLLKHPVFGIALTLFLAAMAAAGFNTIALARLLLVGLFLTVAFAVLTLRAIRMSLSARLAIVIGALLGCVSLDHLLHGHAASDERSKKMADRAMPTPPLMLLFNPRQLFERQILTPLREEGLAVGHVSFPKGGYSGFTLDNAADDVMLGVQQFTITNMSDRSRQFRFSLHVIGEGHNFRLANDGRGRWQRQLNENDFLAMQGGTENGRLSWGLSPMTLPPRRSVETSLGFVAPNAEERLRGIITGGEIDNRYEVQLEVEELPTGKRFSLKLPFGDPPVVDQTLKERVEAAERRLSAAPSNLR
jgi:hypothetical protein